MYLLGIDLGSSFIKASLVDARSATTIATAHSPEIELKIEAPEVGWAEQSPQIWWENCRRAVQILLKKTVIEPSKIAAIGLSYQMHGLVAIDKNGQPVRPAIIWCDSRAVEIGQTTLRELGDDYCFNHLLNAPGNFTASKLAWVKRHEPSVFERIWKIMLPGDFIAFKMTGEPTTTISGLSEGIFWDFLENCPARRLFEQLDFSEKWLPEIVPTFGKQGKLSKKAATELGLAEGTPVTYRAGDQPNNALALNALQPGEIAATGGTSGVVFGVTDRLIFDKKERVNSFAHVNHSAEKPRIGVLLCLNGAGIQYSWLRKMTGNDRSYFELERAAASVPTGADGLRIIPFGNGSERLFQNKNVGAQILNLHFNRHGEAHLFRAALEGVAFSFVFGMKALSELGLNPSILRVGNDNLFQSAIFSSTIADLLGCRIERLDTTGATGAAIASGVGIGLWSEASEGLGQLQSAGIFEPSSRPTELLENAYVDWSARLEKLINQ